MMFAFISNRARRGRDETREERKGTEDEKEIATRGVWCDNGLFF